MNLRELVPGWQDQALCRHYEHGGIGTFYNTSPDKTELAMMRRVCGICPAQPDCLAVAMLEERDMGKSSRFGFRGGFTARERYALSKRWRYNDEGGRSDG